MKAKFDPKLEFPKLFIAIGKIEKPYKIKLKEIAKPYATMVPRRVPIPLRDALQKKLDEMITQEIIEPVDEASECCAPMVIVRKKQGDTRICVDLSELNKNIQRETYPMASVGYIIREYNNAKIFSIIDANSGFWQIMLRPQSSALTTFITPFGRFKFKRLPFGISSAPEVFQKRIRECLKGLNGVVGLMHEFAVYGEARKEHDERLYQVLQRFWKDSKCGKMSV
ncbi:Transposon Ty3-G Gag-Pol polyprotein [Araneus ventricosus]|uniref:Transposon Ty3-G Gag-Pol polyprotein n=1 Tax=Araneus ventricosus TaxID=182803 RepID=A0A4Y2DH84_ARAVE|nr:Transposon Ty3-G Gag-Pol polyprotein [Araneus ventricosus]